MTVKSSTNWNPKWLAFLSDEEGITTDQADALDRPSRISLNARFLCWSMQQMTPERRKLFFNE